MMTPIEIGLVPSPIVLTSGNTAIRTIKTNDAKKISTESFAVNGNCSSKVVFELFSICFLYSGSVEPLQVTPPEAVVYLLELSTFSNIIFTTFYSL